MLEFLLLFCVSPPFYWDGRNSIQEFVVLHGWAQVQGERKHLLKERNSLTSDGIWTHQQQLRSNPIIHLLVENTSLIQPHGPFRDVARLALLLCLRKSFCSYVPRCGTGDSVRLLGPLTGSATTVVISTLKSYRLYVREQGSAPNHIIKSYSSSKGLCGLLRLWQEGGTEGHSPETHLFLHSWGFLISFSPWKLSASYLRAST